MWESYWAHVGVHAATAAQQGAARMVCRIGQELAAIGRLLAIVVFLVLLRVHIVRVESRNKSGDSRRNGKPSI